MKTFNTPGNFSIDFRLSPKDDVSFLFQIRQDENSSILLKIKECYPYLIYKEKGEEDKIFPLECYLGDFLKHNIILKVHDRIDIEINEKFIYSIGEINLKSKEATIYEPLRGSQDGLRIFKFEKI